MFVKTAFCSVFALSFFLPITTLQAETLREAFQMALDQNPTIQSADIAATISNQDVTISKAAVLPNVSASASTSLSRSRTSGVYTTNKDASATVTVTQRLYDHGASLARISQAEHAEEASKEQLRIAVQSVLLEVASTFTDYVHDEAMVELRRSNISLLTKQLEAVRQRFAVGETTLTDVATAEAHLAAAVAELEQARGQLESTRSTYVRLVGQRPGRLTNIDIYSRHVPKNLSRAIDIGLSEHPEIAKGIIDLNAAKEGVKAAEAALGPVVNLSGSLSHTRDIDLSTNTSAFSVSASVQVPLYTGGSLDAGVIKARNIERNAAIGLDASRSVVRSQVSSAWASYHAVKAQVSAVEARIKAEKAALDGTKEEERVGQLTLLDVLNATQSFIQARVSKVQVNRDLTKAAFRLIASMGRLDKNI